MTIHRQANLNTWLLAALIAIAAWQLHEVHDLSSVAAVSVERLAQHDAALVDAKQRIAQTEMEVTRMRIQLATLTRSSVP